MISSMAKMLTTEIKHARCRAILKLLDANIQEALQLAAMVNRVNDHEDAPLRDLVLEPSPPPCAATG
jgi:hypothetical protein